MLTIVADTAGRHDTVGGGAARRKAIVRYGLEKRFMHARRDNFMLACRRGGEGNDKRDIVSNINSSRMRAARDTTLHYEDGGTGSCGASSSGAEIDVIVLISNCPQLNNPANAHTIQMPSKWPFALDPQGTAR